MPTLPAPSILARAVSQVTSTMLGFPVSAIDGPEEHLLWRTATLSIPGSRPVCVALSSNQLGCQALGAAMFSCPPAELDTTMIDDSLCELVNMTAGQIRTLMALDQQLGLPRADAGGGPVTLDQASWRRIVLSSGPIDLLLSVANRSY